MTNERKEKILKAIKEKYLELDISKKLSFEDAWDALGYIPSEVHYECKYITLEDCSTLQELSDYVKELSNKYGDSTEICFELNDDYIQSYLQLKHESTNDELIQDSFGNFKRKLDWNANTDKQIEVLKLKAAINRLERKS